MKILKRKILFCLASEIDFFKVSEGFVYYPYSFLYSRLMISPHQNTVRCGARTQTQNFSVPRKDSKGYFLSFKTRCFKKSSVRDAVLQLARGGEVDKIIRNNVPFFRLTSRGREKLLSFFPQSIGQKKVWDRIWRLAIINSKFKKKKEKSEELRRLRRALEKLGFKKLSRGVYLTPLPISAQLKHLLLGEDFSAKIAVIESRKLLLGDDEQLAKEIWPLDYLLESYQNLITRQKKLLKKLKREKRLTNQDKEQFSLILNDYFSLLEKDPGLPKKLLPPDWPQEKCTLTFLALSFYVNPKKTKTDILR